MRSKPQWQLKLLEGGKPFRTRIEQLMVVDLAFGEGKPQARPPGSQIGLKFAY
jgi:hypothetical protein